MKKIIEEIIKTMDDMQQEIENIFKNQKNFDDRIDYLDGRIEFLGKLFFAGYFILLVMVIIILFIL